MSKDKTQQSSPSAGPSIHCQQDEAMKVQTRVKRRLPKTTLMDCVLLTPLKKRRSNLSVVSPPTSTPTRPGKKRKYHLATPSSNASESPFLGFSTRMDRSLTRRIHSAPSSMAQAQLETNPQALRRPAKRLRVESLREIPNLPIHQHGAATDDIEEDLGLGFDLLNLDDVAAQTNTRESFSDASAHLHVDQIIRDLKHSLDTEGKARRRAEERLLVEMGKRIEMEKMVKDLLHERDESRSWY